MVVAPWKVLVLGRGDLGEEADGGEEAPSPAVVVAPPEEEEVTMDFDLAPRRSSAAAVLLGTSRTGTTGRVVDGQRWWAVLDAVVVVLEGCLRGGGFGESPQLVWCSFLYFWPRRKFSKVTARAGHARATAAAASGSVASREGGRGVERVGRPTATSWLNAVEADRHSFSW